jgi:riboflavin biosynthesis pyrimidine reductase
LKAKGNLGKKNLYKKHAKKEDQNLKPNYKNVWLEGGAMLAKDFIRLKLGDEIKLSVMFILWDGGGTVF